MDFYISYKHVNFFGESQYLNNEQSFFCDPWNDVDFSIILGNSYCGLDLKLDTLKAMQISGVNPKYNWIHQDLSAPKAPIGELLVQGDPSIFEIGMGVHYADDWKTYYSPHSGWVCIGNTVFGDDCNAVTFANNTIAVVKNTMLWAIWVKPKFVD